MKAPWLRIGIFGGSFNPVHKAHVRIAKLAERKLRLDKLIVVPAYRSPDKSAKSYAYAPAADRVKMLELVMPSRVEISWFELNRAKVSYTFETINHFRKLYPTAQLFFIIGSDIIQTLDQWENIAQITKHATFAMFQRRPGDVAHPNVARFQVQTINSRRYPYSSTAFRSGNFSVTFPAVRRYIGAHLLYPEIFPHLFNDERRRIHVQAVAELAMPLGKKLGLDSRAVQFMSLAHDLTKTWTPSEHRAFLDKLRIKHDKYEDFELHAVTAYYYLRRLYKVTNLDVLNAIKKHTTLGTKLTLYDKVLFVADKLEGHMDDLTYKAIYHVLLRDFEAGFRMLVRAYYAELQKKTTVTKRFAKIYQRWM